MKIKDLPASIPLINHPTVMIANDVRTSQGKRFLGKLYQNHKDLLRLLWGRQDLTFSSEFRHWVWIHRFAREQFIVLSGKKGTMYEMVYPSGLTAFRADIAAGELCVRFLERMCRILPTKEE